MALSGTHFRSFSVWADLPARAKTELIPTCVYWSDKNFVKVEIGVGKKKSVNDKRDDLIKKDGEKSIRRAMKGGFD